MDEENNPSIGLTPEIPKSVAGIWNSFSPEVRAALIASETKKSDEGNDASATAEPGASDKKAGLQGRRAKASTGPRMDDSSPNLIGGDSFAKRTSNPGWIKVRSDVYDAVKERRQKELDAKVPVDISVTLPDGKTLTETKVSFYRVASPSSRIKVS